MIHRKEARTLGLAALGAMLEYYDFVIFLFVAAAISEAFFPPGVSPWVSQMQTLGIFAVGYLVRPIAGIVLAHFADMFGRKRMFIFLMILMAVPTFLIGVLPTYEQAGVLAPLALLVLRALQGCAVGGEFPGAAVFVSEHAAPSRLGTASGTMHGIVLAGLLLGTGAAAASAYIASATGIPSLAWRLPFIVGGLFGLTASYLRRQLEESPLYAGIQQSRQLAQATPIRIVLTKHADACLFGLALGFTMAVGTVIFFQYMPTLLATQYGVPRQAALQANMWGSFALCLSMPFWGRLSDTLGWSRSLAIGAVAMLVASVGFFQWLPAVLAGHGSLALLFALPGVALGAVVALVPGLVSALFPTQVRQSGYAVPYNVGAALFGGLTPLALAWMVRAHGPESAMYPLLATALVTAVLAVRVRRMRLYLGVAEPTMPAVAATTKAG
ncbi:MFS transporter [Cupriavidus agavae]|uniref:Nitrate/nitrite transporter NarK n=1 Tax=Cupriavidus agavae TaxID=1001822 RepID=A0A4Q7RT75_9BURK|nr:MFS transporter [Cupriavidus agavae]RZT36855.1 nitrate/nitrite transporter NarK [Cupriavidus agavae]